MGHYFLDTQYNSSDLCTTAKGIHIFDIVKHFYNIFGYCPQARKSMPKFLTIYEYMDITIFFNT